MMASLQRRLTWILLGLILFTWITSAVLLYFSYDEALEEQVDGQLRQYLHIVTYISRVFAQQIDEGLPLYEAWREFGLEELRANPLVVKGVAEDLPTPAVNIWLSGQLIGLIEGSPRFEQPDEEGFTYLTVPGGARYRVLTRYDRVSDLWIRVGVAYDANRSQLLGTVGQALLPLLLVVPLTLFVLYLGVSRGLLPLNKLARQVARRRPGLLDPVATEAVPVEVSALVDAINRLLARLAEALESEQRFTANAAHELMTPLAAIKAEVQLCQRQVGDEAGREMLERIARRVDRASHTVEQLLTLARLDPDAPMPRQPVALRALLVEVLAETAHLAAARGLAVDFEQGEEVMVEGNSEGLAILLRNLLVNAFRYANEGSSVTVRLIAERAPRLEISNECPALSAAEFEQICRRFYRVPGSSGQGAGLGLSIVTRIANLHGASFTAEPGAGGSGFFARLVFPA